MPPADDQPFASRAGLKLEAALKHFDVCPAGWDCADLGSNVGGFVDCLLRYGATRVYAVDTGYGTLAYRLRKDERVGVMERTNAMHVTLPAPVDLVTIDVGWTRQQHILPPATALLKPGGRIISLIKLHYEAPRSLLKRGILPAEQRAAILEQTRARIEEADLKILALMESPIVGQKGNIEYLAHLEPTRAPSA